MIYYEMLIQRNCSICKTQPLNLFFELFKDGIAPDLKGHELVYCHRSIWYCKTCLWGFIESYSHDCFYPDKPWDYAAWFSLEPIDLGILDDYTRSCPDNFDPLCVCPVHLHLQNSFEKIMLRPHTFQSMKSPRVPHLLMVDRVNGQPIFRQADQTYCLYYGTLVFKLNVPD